MEILRGKSWSWKHISIFLYFLLHTLLHLTILTIVKYGRFNQVPYDKRTCIGGTPDAEDIAHTLFECQLYKKDRDQYLRSHFKQMDYWDLCYYNIFHVHPEPKYVALYLNKTVQYRIPQIMEGDTEIQFVFPFNFAFYCIRYSVSCYPCLII